MRSVLPVGLAFFLLGVSVEGNNYKRGKFSLVAAALGASQPASAGNGTGVVSGTVNSASLTRYPTVVYIDEMNGRKFTPPAVNPTVKLTRKFFSPRILPVLVGTTVDFLNSDRRKHYVFSPDGEKYELGKLSRRQKASYTFTSTGVYVQLCSRHPEMVAYVVVVATPYFAVVDESGNFLIPDVPAGAWKLKVWNPRLGPSQLKRSYEANVAPGQVTNMDVAVAPLPWNGKYWLEPPPRADATLVERGQWLFRQKGCFLCHGPEGSRGVPNRNYVKGTVPSLDTLAEKMKLFEPEDVNAIVEHMERGRDLESLADSPPVPGFNVFLAQYRTVHEVIRKGSVAGKKDPKGPTPPLAMPTWAPYLSTADIDALIAYLLTLQPWSEKEQ